MRLSKWFLVASLALFLAGNAFAFGKTIKLALLDQIHPGTTTEQQVRDLLGESAHIVDYPRRGHHDWEYAAVDYGDRLVIWITFGNDGIVLEVNRMKKFGP